MGMSTRVIGYRRADELWRKMSAAWDACTNAGVKVPDDVLKFFDYEPPGDKPGAEVDIGGAIRHYSRDGVDGIEVDCLALPDGVRFVRFENSW